MYSENHDPEGLGQIPVEARRLTESFRKLGFKLFSITQNKYPWGWSLWMEPEDPLAPFRVVRMVQPDPYSDFVLAGSPHGLFMSRCPFQLVESSRSRCGANPSNSCNGLR